jgi:hypothetical protein
MNNVFVIHKNIINDGTLFLLEICDYKYKKDLPNIVLYKIHLFKYEGQHWRNGQLLTASMSRESFCIKKKYKTKKAFLEDNFEDLI